MNALTGQELEAARSAAQQAFRDLKDRVERLDQDAIDVILADARSHYAWQDRPVSEELLREIYEITAAGPTSMNSCPARFVFVTSEAGKAKLVKSVKSTNVAKMMAAPVTAIIAYDIEFWQKLPFLFPHDDRRHHFEGKPEHTEINAFRKPFRQISGMIRLNAEIMDFDNG